MPQQDRKKKIEIPSPEEFFQQPELIPSPTSGLEIPSPEEFFAMRNQALPNPMPAPKVEKQGTLGAVASTIAPVVDLLSRGQYVSAKFFDGLADESKNIMDVISEALDEVYDPKYRLSFTDVIKKRAPEWARDNPKSTAVLGFLFDVGLDPTTYLGVGFAKAGIKVGGQTLTKAGIATMREAIESYGKRAVPAALSNSLNVVEARVRQELIQKGLSGQTLNREVRKQARAAFAEEERKIATAQAKARVQDVPTIVGQSTKRDIKSASLVPLADELEGQLKGLGMQFNAANPWIKFRGKVNDTVLEELGLGLQGFEQGQVLFRKLTAEEVRETAEKRISNLVALEPSAQFKLFEKEGVRLTVGIPFGKRYDVPLTREVFNLIGVNKLADKIGALKSIEFIQKAGGLVSRRFGLGAKIGEKAAAEFERSITTLENSFDSAADSVIRSAQDIFKQLPQDRKELLGETMTLIDDRTRLTEAAIQRINPGAGLTQQAADSIVQRTLAAANLTPNEMSIVSTLQQAYKDMMLIEREADVLKHNIINYNPRMYELLADPQQFIPLWRQSGVGLGGRFTPGIARKFETMAEAKALGYVPVLDAAMLYGGRMLQSKRALAVQQFNESLGEIFQIPNFNVKDPKMFGQLPEIVRDDIKLLGDAVYPKGMNENTKYWLQVVDKLNRGFRQLMTVAKVSFTGRQLVGNTMQAAMVLGAKAFKSFDARAAIDTGLLFLDRGKPTKSLPAFVENLFNKFVGPGETGADAILAGRVALSKVTGEERVRDIASRMGIRGVFGEPISGTDLINEIRSNAIVRGQDFLGEPFNANLAKELAYNSSNLKTVTKNLVFPGKELMFMPWARFPAFVEDYGRSMAYINARRMGYAPKDATKLVNRAYFDYSRGLTNFERNVVRRMIPFYTYQRFAIPLILRTSIERPGTPATIDKFVNMLDKAFNSQNPEDTFTEAEREIAGKSFIFEQPRLYRGFDKDGKLKYNVFNNLTPLDTFSMLVFDKRGEFDPERTFEKTILAALTPLVKVPVETLAYKKQFFSGRSLDDAARLGDLSQSSLSAILPDVVKDAMGWENRVDHRTGRTTTYVNPYLAYAMTGYVPPLKMYLDMAKPEETALDKALKLFIGVQTVKMDLKEQRIWQSIAENAEINELKGEIRKSYTRGALSTYERNMEDYRELLDAIKESRRKQAGSKVRGVGIASTVQQVGGAEQEFR